MRVRFGSRLAVFVNGSGLVHKLVLLWDNGSGVLLSSLLLVQVYQTGPVQDSALNCFASLRQIICDAHLQVFP